MWPQIYQRQAQPLHHTPILIITGRVQREGDVISLLTTHLRPL